MAIFCNGTFQWDTTLSESIPPIKQVNKDGKRYYVIDENDEVRFHSITTILGDNPEKKKALASWRKRVGEKEANRISSFASKRGTKVHGLLEQYLGNDPLNTEEMFPHTIEMFRSAIEPLNQSIDLIYDLEKKLFSTRLQIAGTADGIVKWNGIDSILDFKTSMKPKKEQDIHHYFLQCAAYSVMWKELTGHEIQSMIVFIMVDGEPKPQIFIKSIAPYKRFLIKEVYDFYMRNEFKLPEFFNRIT